MKKHLLLFLILLLTAAFLRFYQLYARTYFNMDEERDAFIVKRIVVNHKLTLIGGSVPGGFYVGPAWYYLSVLPLAIGKLNPLMLSITSVLVGLITIVLMYKFGIEIYGRKIAFIAAVIYSFSYLSVIYSQHYWPLTPAPLTGLLTVFSLVNIIKKKYHYVWLLALALIIGLQSDPSNVVLLLLTIGVFIFYRIPLVKKPVWQSGLAVLASHIPLALFDLRHNFINIKAIISIFLGGQREQEINIFPALIKTVLLFPQTMLRLFYAFADNSNDISKQFTPCKVYENIRINSLPAILVLFSLLMLLIFIFTSIKNKSGGKESIASQVISIQLILSFFGILVFNLFFPSYIREYFLSNLLPAFTIILSIFIVKAYKKKKAIAFVMMIIFVAANLKLIFSAESSWGLKLKVQGVKYALQQVNGKAFYLDSLSTCFKYNGLRYLFYVHGQEPAASFMDSHYSWLYDSPPTSTPPPLKVSFVTHESLDDQTNNKKYQELKKAEISSNTFGGFEVIISRL